MGDVQKYYYQMGLCKALGYNSLNPVLFVASNDKEDLLKQKMDCNAIKTGKCKIFESCKLLQDAPEKIAYNSNELCNRKLG